jgi:hypothetical protein
MASDCHQPILEPTNTSARMDLSATPLFQPILELATNMPNRFQANQHRLAYDLIASRDGEYCLICKRDPHQVKLQIDHADNNPSNWSADNLHLLCQQHNLQLRIVPLKKKLQTIRWHSAKNVCVRERRYGSLSTKVAKDTPDYQSGSVEMQANSMFEPRFTEWLLTNLPMSKEEAINSGAYTVGCSPYTCVRYLKKLTSAAGPLKEFKDGMGIVTLDFKQELTECHLDNSQTSKIRSRKAASDNTRELENEK